MSPVQNRARLLRQVRASLEMLAEDGVQFVPAAPRAARQTQPTAPAPQGDSGRAAGSPMDSPLDAIRADLGDCTRCRLSETRKNIVFGEGNPQAQVVFVGEGPGADEDRTGRPFVGRAGELLTKMIEACGWKRDDVYICNVVKCRPPNNRDPEADEVAACRGFLERQLEAIGPQVIVTLGKPAASTLLNQPVAITRMRGTWREWRGIPLMPTYHPAYVLRNYTRETRQEVWDDLRAVHARVSRARVEGH